MKITRVVANTSHTIYTEDHIYIRYSPESWREELYYDIVSDEHPVDPKIAEELEKLYQIRLGYIPMGEDECSILYDADPNCEHVHDPNNRSGIKCFKCGGWFCR